ncbi:ABC transporter ATP-binding protein/permease [Dongshaea marina]|uniref:ABC transporter ATP-binding protein/permease n=1 Tax=Dongshaea marina TaxID=2047966 RepID=UPI000D3E4AEE|nr:ABC transporter ATP-binding protein/permease [Dongshaea marina]
MNQQSQSSSFVKSVWRLTYPYWRSEEWLKAWSLLIIVIALDLLLIYISVKINAWNRDMFNVFQNYQKEQFWPLVKFFCILAAIFIVAAVCKIYLQMALKINWRRWMTHQYFDRWLGKKAYYQLELNRNQTDNPDQRISEDINMFTDNTLDLSLGLLSNIVNLFAFVTILWGLSNTVTVTFFGPGVHIPGFLVWAALIYAILGSVLTHFVGRPLIKLNFRQQHYEADFRFSMVRLRENAESVALYDGESAEKKRLGKRFTQVWQNYWRIMRWQKNLTAFTAGYHQAAVLFPLLVAAPSYFAKQIKLGGFMQILNAFGQVQSSLSWFVDAYAALAAWKATTDRLLSFNQGMDMAFEKMVKQSHLRYQRGDACTLKEVEVQLPGGSVLLNRSNLELTPGEHLLVSGASGTGKSTLFRVLAGIWPFGDGEVTRPESVLFVPQRPYLPIGPLRDALLYPGFSGAVSDEKLQELLSLCHLEHFRGALDEVQHWAQVMSPGEQQRLSFARALLQRPRWLFLDEATSAIDEQTEQLLYQLLLEELEETTIVSIAHRSTLAHFHQQRLNLQQGQLVMSPIGAI